MVAVSSRYSVVAGASLGASVRGQRHADANEISLGPHIFVADAIKAFDRDKGF